MEGDESWQHLDYGSVLHLYSGIKCDVFCFFHARDMAGASPIFR